MKERRPWSPPLLMRLDTSTEVAGTGPAYPATGPYETGLGGGINSKIQRATETIIGCTAYGPGLAGAS